MPAPLRRSPSAALSPSIVVNTPGKGYLTPGIRKFVDTLSGLTPAGVNNLGNYIPVAQPDTTTYPGTDYYEIGLVQYRQQFHSDLPETLLRGYVQLSTSVTQTFDDAGGLATDLQVPLTNANLDPAITASPALLPAIAAIRRTGGRRRPAPLPGPDDRRHEGQASTNPVPQPAPDR